MRKKERVNIYALFSIVIMAILNEYNLTIE